MAGAASIKSKIKSLGAFSACDISDALLKLKVPRSGFLADLNPYAPHAPHSEALKFQNKVIAPASTVLFVPKDFPPPPSSLPSSTHTSASPDTTATTSQSCPTESNIPPDEHYVDLTPPDTIMVLSQPAGQNCAVIGGIMALRMKKLGALGIVLDGRIRDLTELRSLKLPVWAKSTSTVGTGAEAKPWALNVPINIAGVDVNPGDIVFCDPVEGVVVVPQEKLDQLLDLLPKLTDADDGVKKDVSEGRGVRESFAKWRSNL